MWRVNDRRRHHRTEGTTVGDGEGTTGHLIDGQLAVTGFLAEAGDAAFDFSQAHQLGVTQDRNHQATVAGHGNADVGIAVVNDVAAVDGSVDCREAFQRFGGRFHEERHEAQAHAVVGLLEQILVLRTQGHDFGHVDFVERGQHRHVRLCFNQTLGHGGTHAGHRHALLGAVASGEHRSSGSRCCSLGGCGSWSVFLGFNGSNHVFLGHTAVFAGAFDGSQVDAVLFGQLTSSRCSDWIFATRRRSGSWSRSRNSRCSGSRSGSSAARFDRAQYLVGQDGIAFVGNDRAQHAVSFSQHFQNDFVGLDVDDQFVTLYSLAWFLVPSGNGAIGNRFRECRGFDFDSHYLWVLKIRFQSARRR